MQHWLSSMFVAIVPVLFINIEMSGENNFYRARVDDRYVYAYLTLLFSTKQAIDKISHFPNRMERLIPQPNNNPCSSAVAPAPTSP